MVHSINKDNSKIYHIDAVNETLRNLNDAPTGLHTRPDMGYTIYFHPITKDIIPLMDYDKSLIYLNEEELVYTNDVDLINKGYVPIRPGKRSNLLHRWRWGFNSFKDRIDEIVIKKSNGKYGAFFKQFGFNAPKNIINISSGTTELKNLFSGNSVFPNPKNTSFISRVVAISTNKTDLILDYFAGSGTTAHAVINLNREDNGNRQYILVEQGEYFDTVLKPRVQKVIYSQEWKDGKPVPDKVSGSLNGVPQIVKVLKLESYEDTLNNLELRRSGLFDHLPENAQHDYLLHYMLNIESRDSLLNVSHFAKPFDYQLKIATNSAGAFDNKNIDLVETFNYLIGATVIGVDDKRSEQGFVAVECRLPNQHTDEKTLIFWRDCERIGYDELQQQFDRLGINPADSEYSQVYVNGDHTLETVWDGEQSGSLKIRSIEAEFLALMFAGDE